MNNLQVVLHTLMVFFLAACSLALGVVFIMNWNWMALMGGIFIAAFIPAYINAGDTDNLLTSTVNDDDCKVVEMYPVIASPADIVKLDLRKTLIGEDNIPAILAHNKSYAQKLRESIDRRAKKHPELVVSSTISPPTKAEASNEPNANQLRP